MDIESILNICGLSYITHSDFYRIRCLNLNYHEKGDEHPSLCIYKDSQIGYCYTCGYTIHINKLYYLITGNKLNDNAEYNKYQYNQTLKYKNKIEPAKVRKLDEVIIESDLQSVYNNDIAYRYCISKGLNKDFIKFFKIKVLQKGRVYVKGKEDKPIFVYNRLVFPVVENKKVVSVELRDYTESQSKKVLYPRGSYVSTLFGIDNLDYNQPLHLTEGIKSLWKIWQTISHNSTSCFGIKINPIQAKLLNKFPEIILWSDNDKAGEQFITNLDECLDDDKKIWICNRNGIFDDSDPNDYSTEEIKTIYQNKLILAEYDINKVDFFKKPDYTI